MLIYSVGAPLVRGDRESKSAATTEKKRENKVLDHLVYYQSWDENGGATFDAHKEIVFLNFGRASSFPSKAMKQD